MKLKENGKQYHATKTSQPRMGGQSLYQVSIDNQDAGVFWAKNLREAIIRCIEEQDDKLARSFPRLYLVK